MFKFILAATAALTLAAPIGALAQDVPSYAQQSADEQIRGRVLSFDGGYALAVRDERGFIDNVQLHDGTIINPTGITLEPGMVVSVIGANDGDVLSANEIDTPYTFDGGDVAFYDGHPWNYFGPSFGLAFFFGNAGWWHGNDFGGGFRYVGGARVYDRVTIHDRVVNRGGGETYRPNPGNYQRYAAAQQPERREAAPAYRSQEPAYRSQESAYRAQAPAYRVPAAPAYHAAAAPAYREAAAPAYRAPAAPAPRGQAGRGESDRHH